MLLNKSGRIWLSLWDAPQLTVGERSCRLWWGHAFSQTFTLPAGCDLHVTHITLSLIQMQTTFWLTNVNSLATVSYRGGWETSACCRCALSALKRSLWVHVIASVLTLNDCGLWIDWFFSLFINVVLIIIPWRCDFIHYTQECWLQTGLGAAAHSSAPVMKKERFRMSQCDLRKSFTCQKKVLGFLWKRAKNWGAL